MLITEYSTDPEPLAGAVDGVNRRYTTRYAMNLSYVAVIINGTPMSPEVDNGWVIIDANTVEMKEAPAAVDTVAVEYATGATKGGGGPGGPAGTAVTLQAVEDRPVTGVVVGNDAPSTLTACICTDCD